MTTALRLKTLSISEDYEFVLRLSRRVAATGLVTPLTGITTLTAEVVLALGGSAVDASLDLAMTERASTPGEYFCLFDAPNMLQHLTAQNRKRCWIRAEIPNDLVRYFPRRVVLYAEGANP